MCDFLRGAPGPTIATARMSEGIRSNGDLYTCSIFCFCWWYFLWESAHRVRRVSSHPVHRSAYHCCYCCCAAAAAPDVRRQGRRQMLMGR